MMRLSAKVPGRVKPGILSHGRGGFAALIAAAALLLGAVTPAHAGGPAGVSPRVVAAPAVNASPRPMATPAVSASPRAMATPAIHAPPRTMTTPRLGAAPAFVPPRGSIPPAPRMVAGSAEISGSLLGRDLRITVPVPVPAPRLTNPASLAVGDVITVPATLFGGEAGSFYSAQIEALEVEDAPLLVAQAPQRPPAQGAPAAAESAAPQHIQVELMVIHASNEKKGFDPRIARFKKQLSFLSYTALDLMDSERFTLDTGETHKVTVAEGNVIETTLVSGNEARVHLRMRLIRPEPQGDVLLDTTVTVPRNGTFFVGGPKYNRGALILPVTATY